MIRLCQKDLDACLNVVFELNSDLDADRFADRLMPLLARLVPVDYCTWNNFNERNRQYKIRYYPARVQVEHLMPQFAETFHTSPLFDHYQQRGSQPKRISDTTTLREFQKTAIYNEYYRHIGMRHQMIFFLHGKKEIRIVPAFNRARRDFSERDRDVLALLSPHIARAYRNAQIASRLKASLSHIGGGLDALSRAVILAEAGGQILWLSPLAREWLAESFADFTPAGEQLPQAITRWLERLERSAQAGRPKFSEIQIPAPAKQRLMAYGGKTGNEYVIVLMRERDEINAVAAQSHGLTTREAEILFWMSEAKTRQEIATILRVSWRTVGKHIEHIFDKLGVDNHLQAQRIGLELRRA